MHVAVAHRSPPHPATQLQMKDDAPLKHMPPFKQVLGLQKFVTGGAVIRVYSFVLGVSVRV